MAEPKVSYPAGWPTVSAVVAASRSKYLEETLESILHQTRPADEIIVVASRVEADPVIADILRAYDSEVTYQLEPGPLNANEARNRGVSMASSDLIALSDDDDIWRPNKLAAQLTQLTSVERPFPLWLSTSGVEAFSEGDPRLHYWPYYPPTEPISSYLVGRTRFSSRPNFLQTSTWLAPAEVFRRFPFDETRPIHQDLDWLIRHVSKSGVKLLFVPQPLTAYRRRSKGSVSTANRWPASLKWISNPDLPVSRRDRSDFFFTTILPSLMVSEGPRRAIKTVVELGYFNPHLPAVYGAMRGLAGQVLSQFRG